LYSTAFYRDNNKLHLLSKTYKMKKITTKILGAFMISAILFSCAKQKDTLAPEDSITDEVKQMAFDAGFHTDNIVKHDDGYLIEGDIYMTKDQLAAMRNPSYDNNLIVANTEHYRTTNLVTGTRTISVSLNTSQANFVSATDEAIRRYNALPLRIKFQRVSGTNGNIRIVTFNQVSNTLGSAGFPSGGNPFGQIQMNLYWYTPSIAVNALATTIAHEMGHCVGFRHTDYMNRAYSCGSGGNEGASTVGAVYIPGTPSGPSAGSWMLACGSTASSFNRPFTSADQTALNYVY
jgi:Dual-action HEIGH metallo-peptidase